MADGGGVAPADARVSQWRHDGAMTRNSHHRPSDEERAFFERLLMLRRRYAAKGTDDAEPVIGLHHAIVSANAAMANVPSGHVHLGIAGN